MERRTFLALSLNSQLMVYPPGDDCTPGEPPIAAGSLDRALRRISKWEGKMDEVKDRRGDLGRRAALGLMSTPMAAAALHATSAEARSASSLDLTKPAWPNGRIYIHETLNLTVRDRKAYLDLFGTWPEAARKVGSPLRCVGIWGTLGNSHNWAEGVV